MGDEREKKKGGAVKGETKERRKGGKKGRKKAMQEEKEVKWEERSRGMFS